MDPLRHSTLPPFWGTGTWASAVFRGKCRKCTASTAGDKSIRPTDRTAADWSGASNKCRRVHMEKVVQVSAQNCIVIKTEGGCCPRPNYCHRTHCHASSTCAPLHADYESIESRKPSTCFPASTIGPQSETPSPPPSTNGPPMEET